MCSCEMLSITPAFPAVARLARGIAAFSKHAFQMDRCMSWADWAQACFFGSFKLKLWGRVMLGMLGVSDASVLSLTAGFRSLGCFCLGPVSYRI